MLFEEPFVIQPESAHGFTVGFDPGRLIFTGEVRSRVFFWGDERSTVDFAPKAKRLRFASESLKERERDGEIERLER